MKMRLLNSPLSQSQGSKTASQVPVAVTCLLISALALSIQSCDVKPGMPGHNADGSEESAAPAPGSPAAQDKAAAAAAATTPNGPGTGAAALSLPTAVLTCESGDPAVPLSTLNARRDSLKTATPQDIAKKALGFARDPLGPNLSFPSAKAFALALAGRDDAATSYTTYVAAYKYAAAKDTGLGLGIPEAMAFANTQSELKNAPEPLAVYVCAYRFALNSLKDPKGAKFIELEAKSFSDQAALKTNPLVWLKSFIYSYGIAFTDKDGLNDTPTEALAYSTAQADIAAAKAVPSPTPSQMPSPAPAAAAGGAGPAVGASVGHPPTLVELPTGDPAVEGEVAGPADNVTN